MKFCKDCRHYKATENIGQSSINQHDLCMHTDARAFDISALICGPDHNTRQKSCYVMRDIAYFCGPDAKLFEAKESGHAETQS